MERQNREEMSVNLYAFSLVFEAEVEADKKRYNETNPYYGVYRALKSTMRSEEVNSLSLGTSDVYSIIHFLMANDDLRYALKDWVETSSWEWEMGWLGKNARKIYVVGKQEVLRRNGLKHSRALSR